MGPRTIRIITRLLQPFFTLLRGRKQMVPTLRL